MVARKFIENLSEKLNTTITVGKLRYGLNNNLIIRDLYIADQHNDTLFYANRIEAHINQLNLNSKNIDLKSITLKYCEGNVRQYSDSVYNFSFIQQALKKNDSTKFDWNIEIAQIELIKSKANFWGINQQFKSSNTTASITNFTIDSTQMAFSVDRFSNQLNNQDFLRNVMFKVQKNANTLQINAFKLLTLNSFIQFNQLAIAKKSNHLTFNVEELNTRLFLHEFRNLIPDLKNRREFLTLSGNLNYTNPDLSGNNVRIQLGKASMIQSDFSIRNINNKSLLTYQFDINELFSNAGDINYIYTKYLNKNALQFPEIITNLGDINYRGKLTGNTSMVYSKGNITTNIGKLESDIQISYDDSTKHILLDGGISAKPLYLKRLADNQPVSEISFSFNTKGYFSKIKGPHLNVDGMLHHFYVNQQRIDSVKVKGNLDAEKFNGRISSFDPNLRFDLDGLFDLDTLPSYDFNLTLYNANLSKLGISKSDSLSNLSMNVKANFFGNSLNNTTGDISVTDLFYFRDTNYFATDSISISSKLVNNKKQFQLKSEYLHAELNGNYNTLTLKRSIESLIHYHLPSLGIKPSKPDTLNNFNFLIVADYPQPIMELLFPDYKISSGTTITGEFNAANKALSISCFSERVEFFNKDIMDFNLKAYTRNENIFLNIDSKAFRYTDKTSLKNFMSSFKIHNDSININFNWNNWLENSYSGNLNTLLTLKPTGIEKKPDLKFDLFPSNIVVIDTIWYISQGFIEKDSSQFNFSNLKIDNGNSRCSINGSLSKNPNDSIVFDLENMSMSHLNVLLKKDNIKFGGELSGKTSIKDIYGEKRIASNLFIDDFSLNGEQVGDTKITSFWDNLNKQIMVSLMANYEGTNALSAQGAIIPSDKEMDLDVTLHKQRFKILEPFLRPNLIDFKGTVSGTARLYGPLINPKWDGQLFADKVGLNIASTNVDYYFSDTVQLKERKILFNKVTVFDYENDSALLTGVISHNRFETYTVEAHLSTNKILGIKTTMADNPLYYGTVYGSGDVKLSLINNIFNLDIVATTLNNSYFYVPLEGKSDLKENDFIEFINTQVVEQKESKKTVEIPKNKVKLNFHLDLNVTPEAEVQIIFDPEIGDVLTANGFAQLNIESINGGFNMYGDYTINKGEFMFTLQNVINKKLDIQPNSSVSWTGDPLDAIINLDAIYKIRKASVSDLTQDPTEDRRVEVDCHLKMTDKLINPTIKFSVEVPSATNVTAIDQINSLPEDELNKQVLSLLLINKFTPLYQQTNTTASSKNLGSTTVSELLSNQLSNWLSQINSAFDLGFVYRPGDENTQQEYEVALSTNLWNDRISINGNVGYSSQVQTATPDKSPYTTDFQIELKLNKKGNIRLRAFQKVNNDIEYSQTPYTQGLGVFYTEEFDTFDDLLNKLFHDEYATKPKEVKIQNIED